jgi:hypothetical protein
MGEDRKSPPTHGMKAPNHRGRHVSRRGKVRGGRGAAKDLHLVTKKELIFPSPLHLLPALTPWRPHGIHVCSRETRVVFS